MVDRDLFYSNILMNGIKDMVYVMEVDNGQFIYKFINQVVKELAGFTDSIIGKTFQDVLPKEKASFLIDKYNAVLRSKEIVVYEDDYPSIKGEIRYGENTLSPIYNEHNECTHIVGVVKDITEQKKAEKVAEKSKEMLIEGKERYQSLFDYNLDAVITLDINGLLITGNHSLETMTGYHIHDLTGSSYLRLIFPGQIKKAKKYYEQALNGVPEEFRLTIKNKDRKKVELVAKFSPIVVKEEIVGVYVICKDITEQIKFKDKYNESENIFEIITEHSRDLITMLNSEGEYIYASPSYKDVLGFTRDEFLGKKFYHNIYPDDIEHLKKTFYLSKKKGEPWKEQFRQKHETEGYIWSELHGSPVYDDHHNFKQMVVVSRDISTRKNYESKLEAFAYHDELTGLPNRRYFIENLEKSLSEKRSLKNRFAVIMIDLDKLKPINDTYGHDVGDEFLKEFSKRVNQVIREGDTFARLGGDEFAIFIPKIDIIQNVSNVARRIIKVLEQPWDIDNNSIFIRASVGIAISSFKAESVQNLLKTADEALYEVKDMGGNNYKLKYI
ncbi:diguanylate cyclase [Ornithinibacillus sp. L9]|uniref:Diguanylate cyclase n=1 Tax=Ornithinibacillus caprae TaxID=2678566 RepID=A0A6N8FI69_9BACI|nr:diguanylate cyclase [Ornithinibacillus caprae]MUK88931.1 diguanylate cyclase [Ornithinibacillus caprae]